MTRFAAHPHAAPEALGDGMDSRQAEAGALVHLLGGEERIEERFMLDDAGREAAALVDADPLVSGVGQARGT